MSIKSVLKCLFARNPIPKIDENVTFVLYKPKNPVFLSSNDDRIQPLEFNDVGDQKPSKSIPSFYPKYQDSVESITEGVAIPEAPMGDIMKYIRIIYFVFLEKGEILTVSFQKIYENNDADKKWMLKKYEKLNSFRGDPDKIIRYFDSNPNSERVSRGLDQDFSETAVVFFYIYNEHMVFSGDKFSFMQVPDNPPNLGKPNSPFTMIKTSEQAKFFGLFNDFYDSLPVSTPYRYKFNLHMETIGYTVDKPHTIPFLIDPAVQNDGPPR